MIGLTVLDVKEFMSKLLTKETFDHFHVKEVELNTFTKFKIDGYLHKDYYTIEEQEAIGERKQCLWSDVKGVAYELIKGKKLPISFKVIFQLPDNHVQWLIDHHGLKHTLEDIGGLYLKFVYENKQLSCITGMSLKVFSMDKSLEQVWDQSVCLLMKKNQIGISEQ